MERAKRMEISIHAPHEGVRRKRKALSCWKCYFNPRTPRGGATLLAHGIDGNDIISIHAPHEGVRHVALFQLVEPVISIHAPHEGVRL